MPLVVPNPTVPTNGQALDATPLLANLQAVYQAIQSFDASQVAAGTLTASAFNAAINPNTRANEMTFPFISAGCNWSIVSGLNATMTSGTIYVNGIRVTVNSVASNPFLVNTDNYIDIDVNGNVTYQSVANNAASPAITANAIRVAIIVTGGSITFINQGQNDIGLSGFAPIVSSTSVSVTDTLGNLIHPMDPNRKLLGYRSIVSGFSTASNSAVLVTGLTLPIIIPNGRRIAIKFHIPGVTNSGTNYNFPGIYDTAVGVTRLGGVTVHSDGASDQVGADPEVVTIPSSSNKIYVAGFYVGAGTGTINADAIGSEHGPAYIKAELS